MFKKLRPSIIQEAEYFGLHKLDKMEDTKEVKTPPTSYERVVRGKTKEKIFKALEDLTNKVVNYFAAADKHTESVIPWMGGKEIVCHFLATPWTDNHRTCEKIFRYYGGVVSNSADSKWRNLITQNIY